MMILLNGLRPAGRVMTHSSRRFGWIEISLLALVLAMGILGAGIPQNAQATMLFPQATSPVFVPMVSNGVQPHIDGRQQPKPPAEPAPKPVCQLNVEENAILSAMIQHPEQGRAVIECNPILSQVARAKAVDMAKRGYFAHVNPEGQGPNYLVTAAGFRLPDYYPKTGSANNIESIGAGYSSPGDVWIAWLDSHYHRIHVLGTDGFYASQHQVGVGYYYDANSYYKHYWVVMTAPTEK